MRVTRLQFVERMGEPTFFALLAMSKQSIEIEWAEAEAWELFELEVGR